MKGTPPLRTCVQAMALPTALGDGTLSKHYQIHIQEPTQVLMTQIGEQNDSSGAPVRQ